MRIHCPHCSKEFEKGQFPLGDEVTCIHCERPFVLSQKETVPLAAAEAASPGVAEVGGEAAANGNGGADRSKVRNTQLTPLPGSPEVGGQLGGYILERELGRGGMGVVYLANQESLARKVAVKVLPQNLSEDESFVRRFDREAQSLAKLNHPNIVSILDKGNDGGVYYFVMEYVDGVALRDILEEKRLSPTEALRIIRQVCDALEYAHDEGVVHRDIKPENILIDRKGTAKIADFGLARLVRGDAPHSRITRSQMVMGSPDYMAPEQRENARDVDHRADLYSLGVVLYEMLTGELPIGNFPPPSQKNIGLDVNIDRIVLKVLEKNPELRYRQASEVKTEIDGLGKRAVNGAAAAAGAAAAWIPTAEQAKGFGREMGLFIRQHPWVVIPLAIGFGLAAIGIGPYVAGVAWVIIPIAVIGWLWHATHMEEQTKQLKMKMRASAAQELKGVEVAMRKAEEAAEKADPKSRKEVKEAVEQVKDAVEVATGKRAIAAGSYSVIAPIVFGFVCLVVVALLILTGPVAPLIQDAFHSFDTEEMIVFLIISLVIFLPLLPLLALGFYARARTKRYKQRGRFFATLAVILSLISIGWIYSEWSDYSHDFSYYHDLEERAAGGEPRALSTYERSLSSGDLRVRRRAAYSVFRAEGEHIVPLLGKIMNMTDRRLPERAAGLLGRHGEVALPYLVAGLEHPSSDVRYDCARSLASRVPFDLNYKAFGSHGHDRAEELAEVQAWWKKRQAELTAEKELFETSAEAAHSIEIQDGAEAIGVGAEQY